ncbi:glutathione S-transferase zeta class-like isoform X5 [Olea europaea var. sylvestris]|uniref:glutathione S-transferase zeta class-like isoform X5 n=1 Tax=Olea europaea var. sylvestris TaxID=158386 RepID=UPI000C1D45A6|nr:glutathione S-transferase zeta class-like isoform X5 [Olea europaea var. sylvestris]
MKKQNPPLIQSLQSLFSPIMASGTGEVSKKLKLYSNWRSSCSCRVRIALKLKEFLKLNPLGYVPVLVDGDFVVADSFAILLYLEEKYPQHPLLPKDLQKRALNYQAANLVSANIQPLQNLSVLGYIHEKLGPDEEIPLAQTHIRKGFAALEKLLENYAGKYATGNEVFLADLFLAPQIDGAVRRFNVDMSEYPILSRINEAYKELPAFQDAMPGKQPDTPPEARA